jgi:predicted DNA-binding transcriptional regulator AlpA
MQSVSELSPDTILSFKDWLKLAGISKATGQLLRKTGDAPRFWQISPKRVGTTVAEHRKWMASRPAA